MKNLLLVSGSLLFSTIALAQGKNEATEQLKTSVYKSTASIFLPYSPTVVLKALHNNLSTTKNIKPGTSVPYSLTSNILIAKNNKTNADMHFVVGPREPGSTNESVIYLKRPPLSNTDPGTVSPIDIDMQDARDYLNDLARAIKPYAKALQVTLQESDLADAENQNTSLIDEGNRLEEKGNIIDAKINNRNSQKKEGRLSARKARNDKLIGENQAARISIGDEIAKQATALALLTIKLNP